VLSEVAEVTEATSLEAEPRLTTSPWIKSVLKEVPVPVTALPERATVPVPETLIAVEKVTAQLLVIVNLPIVSLVGILVTVTVLCTAPLNTRTSFAAGDVRAGDQLPDASKSPEVTFHVYVVCPRLFNPIKEIKRKSKTFLISVFLNLNVLSKINLKKVVSDTYMCE
jgi:hypothetical protein